MDVEHFWENIKFKFEYREKGMFIMTAVVNSTGYPLQLKVVSRNRAERLSQMQWLYIYGIPYTTGGEQVQYFRAPYTLNAYLEEIPSGSISEILYVHKFDPYTITRHISPTEMTMSVRDDNIKLAEAISTPSFTIKRLARPR